MIVLKALSLILLLVVLPAMAGIMPLRFFKETDRTFAKAVILGYIISLAILEFVGIPVVLLCVYTGYVFIIVLFLVLLVFVAFLGLYISYKDYSRAVKNDRKFFGLRSIISEGITRIKNSSLEAKIYLLITVLFVLFQMIMALRLASYDVDDAYYNAYARTAQQYGTLYRADPSTGKSFDLDMRHAMALFPIFQAIVSTLSGVHLLVVCHKIMPLILIPLSYMLIFEISGHFFRDSEEKHWLFMILVNIFRIFGNVSEYTTETFFFIRTWQGKSLAGNFIIPALLWLFLSLKEDRENKNGTIYWIFIAILILAGGSSSSLSVMLTSAMTLLYGALFAIKEKSLKSLWRSALACCPGVIYILIYVLN